MLQAKYCHPRRQLLAQRTHIQLRFKYRIDPQHRLQYIVVLKEHLPPVAPYLAIQALTLQSLAQIQHIRVFSRLHYLHQVHHYSLRMSAARCMAIVSALGCLSYSIMCIWRGVISGGGKIGQKKPVFHCFI